MVWKVGSAEYPKVVVSTYRVHFSAMKNDAEYFFGFLWNGTE